MSASEMNNFSDMLQCIAAVPADNPDYFYSSLFARHFMNVLLHADTHAVVICAPRRAGKTTFINRLIDDLFTKWCEDDNRQNFKIVLYSVTIRTAVQPRDEQLGEHSFRVIVFDDGRHGLRAIVTDADVFFFDEFNRLPGPLRLELVAALRYMFRPVFVIGTPYDTEDLDVPRTRIQMFDAQNRYCGVIMHECLATWVDRNLALRIEHEQ